MLTKSYSAGEVVDPKNVSGIGEIDRANSTNGTLHCQHQSLGPVA